MTQNNFTVKSNKILASGVFKMVLEGDTNSITAPGQFVNIALDGLYLRRPISVCDVSEGELTLIYKTIGRGTDAMSALTPGARLDILTGLGNGYDLSKCGSVPLLVGGGVGVPPLLLLAKELIRAGKQPKVILGFNTAEEIFLEKDFQSLGLEVYITTIDGSYENGNNNRNLSRSQQPTGINRNLPKPQLPTGIKGFVTDAFGAAGDFDYIFACGPEPMLKAIYHKTDRNGQFSFEERMGCGFGACMGCTCKTKYGNKRICREGPVLERGEIIW